MHKYKIGQKVKIGGDYPGAGLSRGSITAVKGYCKETPNAPYLLSLSGNWKESWLEPVYKFKKGDEVRILSKAKCACPEGAARGWDWIKSIYGSIPSGKISRFEYDHYEILGFFFLESDLELYEEQVDPLKVPAPIAYDTFVSVYDELYGGMTKSMQTEYPAHFMDWAQNGGDTMNLNKLTKEQEEILTPEDQALFELGVMTSKFELNNSDYVIKFLFKKYKKEIAAEAMAEVKAIKKAEKAAK